jgi:2-polyprenyl-3-methyl-5-hydroxy-6-metoxy-1,4-benzoquinol methylase
MITLADFRHRSTQTELIDDMSLDSTQMAGVLRELAVVNKYLGGYATTIGALDKLFGSDDRPLRLLDVGAGGGDMARQLVEWGRSRGRRVEVVTLDLSRAAARYARDAVADYPEISVVQANVLQLPFEPGTFDAVLAALFLHHFPTPDATCALRSMAAACRTAVVVNDLHRHPLAYAGIWSLTRMLGASPIVQNDGPVSVLRAFTRRDFDELARATGLSMTVRWRWAFRYQVIVRADAAGEVKRDGV